MKIKAEADIDDIIEISPGTEHERWYRHLGDLYEGRTAEHLSDLEFSNFYYKMYCNRMNIAILLVSLCVFSYYAAMLDVCK